MGSESTNQLSLKKKLKSKFCITGCFRTTNYPNDIPDEPSPPTTPTDKSTQSPRGGIMTKSPRLTRTLSKSHEKCRNLINRFGGGVGGSGVTGRGRHIRRHTTDFHYDVSSYALNFDRGDDNDNVDHFPIRNFSARLPHSPPSSVNATTTELSFMVHQLSR